MIFSKCRSSARFISSPRSLQNPERRIALEKNKWGKYYKEMISFLIPLLEDFVAATFISVQNFYY